MSNWGSFPGTLLVRTGPQNEGPHQVRMRPSWGPHLPGSSPGRDVPPIGRSLVLEGTGQNKGRQERTGVLGIRDGVVGTESLGHDGDC